MRTGTAYARVLASLHISLQSGATLSGGEAQRVKLATELQRRTRGRNIYVLDEPTTACTSTT